VVWGAGLVRLLLGVVSSVVDAGAPCGNAQNELSSTGTPRVKDIVKKTTNNLVPRVHASKPVIVSSENVAPATATVAKKKPRARPIKMKVDGIAQEYWRSMVEKALIRVPGVISVTLNKRREEAIVYTKQREGMVSKLVKAVQGLGMEATPLDGRATVTPPSASRTPAKPVRCCPRVSKSRTHPLVLFLSPSSTHLEAVFAWFALPPLTHLASRSCLCLLVPSCADPQALCFRAGAGVP